MTQCLPVGTLAVLCHFGLPNLADSRARGWAHIHLSWLSIMAGDRPVVILQIANPTNYRSVGEPKSKLASWRGRRKLAAFWCSARVRHRAESRGTQAMRAGSAGARGLAGRNLVQN